MSQPYKSGRQKNLNLGISSITENSTVLQVTGKVGIGTTFADGRSLYVIGDAEITGVTTLATNGGITTTGGNLFVGKSLYVKDNLVISGLTTFTSDVDIDGSLNVDTNVNVVGFSTFNNNVDINNSLNVDQNVNVTGFSTFNNNVDINNSLNVDQNVTVTGLSTFTGLLDANGGATIDNVRIGVANDNTIDTSIGNLTIDSNGGTVTVTDQFVVTGISTFNNNVDLDNSLNVDQNVNVTGLSTFVGIVTNQSTIFGTQLSVSGVSTFVGLVDANGGAEIDNIRIGIANDNEIDTSIGNLVIDSAGGTVTVDDQLVVSGITTFNNNVDVDQSLNVDSNLTVTGLSTFVGIVTNQSTIFGTQVSVSGISTFTGLVDANGGATINNIRIGVANDNEIDTSTGNLVIDSAGGTVTVDDQLIVVGVSTFNNIVDIDQSLNVDGNVNVTGLSTFTGLLDANGGATIDNIRIGVADNNTIDTSTGGLTLNSNSGTVTVDDNLAVSGSNTLSFNSSSLNISHSGGNANIFNGLGDLILGADGNGSIRLERVGIATLAKFTHGGSAELYFDGSKKLETLGAGVTIIGTNFANQLSISGVSTLAANGGITTTGGDLFVGKSLYVKDNLVISGLTTFTGDVDIDKSLNIDQNLTVTGLSTFTGLLDANGGATIDNIRIGVANDNTIDTSIGNLVIDSSGGTVTVNDQLIVVGVSTFNNIVDIDQSLNVDGNVNVTGLSTFVGIVTNQSTIFGKQLNISGISTLNGLLDANAGATIDNIQIGISNDNEIDTSTGNLVIDSAGGTTTIDDQLIVTGITTFNNDVDIDKSLNIDNNLTVIGISTFTGDIDANGSIDVDGHTELDNVNVSGIATINNLDVTGQFDVYDTTATFHNNVRIDGNLSIGGTTTVILAQDLKIFDKEITLGVTTDAFGNDISNDVTANHGGVAVASTVGSPLVDLSLVGFSTMPATYKQLMWVAANSYGIGTTDAWMFNYAVGIGSTLVPNGAYLAVGAIQATKDTLTAPNINVTNLNVTGLSTLGVATASQFAVSGVSTFAGLLDANGGATIDNIRIGIADDNTIDTSTGNLTIDSNGGTVNITDQLNVSGVATFQSNVRLGDNDILSFGDGNDLQILHDGSDSYIRDFGVGNLVILTNGFAVNNTANNENMITATENGAVNLFNDGIAKLETTGYGVTVFGTLQSQQLNVTGVSTLAANGGITTTGGDLFVGNDLFVKDDIFSDEITSRNINVTGVSTLGVASATTLFVSGVSTFSSLIDANGGLDVVGGFTLDNLNVTGLSTFVGITTNQSTLFTNQINALGLSTFIGLTTSTSTLFANQFSVVGPSTFVGIVTNQSTIFGTQLRVSGVSTLSTLHAPRITYNGVDFGVNGFVPVADGAGGWTWGSVTSTFSVNNILNGFNVKDEGNFVGTAGSITTLDFRGNNIVASADPQPNGIATITLSDTPTFLNLTVSPGITTLGVTTSIETIFANQLSVSGLSTFVGVGTFVGDLYVGGDLYIADDVVFDSFTAREITVTEKSSLGIASATTLRVTGISTFANVDASTINVTGVVTASTFNGNINAGVGTITTLNSTTGNITTLNSTTANILTGIVTSLTGTNLVYTGIGTIDTLRSNVGIITELTATTLNVTGVSTFAGITTVTGSTLFAKQIDVSGIVTARQFSGYRALVGTASSTTETFVVTVASKTANHRYFGTGSGNAFYIDGRESPFITLLPGKTYRFDQADSSNSGHPLLFYLEADKTTQYTTNITTNGTPGNATAYTEITIVDQVPIVLHYQCANHSYMGNAVQTNSNLINTPYNIIGLGNLNITGSSTLTGITTSSSTLFAKQLSVVGVATVTNGPLIIGSGTSTGTTAQPLQVTGGAYVSDRVGIGTTLPRSTYKVDIIGDVNFDGNLYQNNTRFVAGIGIGSTSVNPGSSIITQRIGVGFTDLNIVGSGISVTGYGSTIVVDFSTLSAAAGALSISTSTVSVPQDITFVGGAGTSIIGIATVTDRFVYVPSTGRVGIGTSAPAYKLDVIGDINSSTSVKIKGVDVLEEAVRLAIALG